jgi:hypothetical protein
MQTTDYLNFATNSFAGLRLTDQESMKYIKNRILKLKKKKYFQFCSVVYGELLIVGSYFFCWKTDEVLN